MMGPASAFSIILDLAGDCGSRRTLQPRLLKLCNLVLLKRTIVVKGGISSTTTQIVESGKGADYFK